MSDLGTCTKCKKVFSIDLLYPCEACDKELCEACTYYDKELEHVGCESCMELWGCEE